MLKNTIIFICTFLFVASSMMFYKSIKNKKEVQKAMYYMELSSLYINSLEDQLVSCNNKVEQITKTMEFISVVDVTMYNAVEGQTDSTPLITASSRDINPEFATDHRWIAVSRDLHVRWGGPLHFGDRVFISGTEEYDGIYTVHDTMNERFTNRIDILRHEDSELFKYSDIQLYRILNIKPDYHNAYDFKANNNSTFYSKK